MTKKKEAEAKPGSLVIAETSTSTWNYHLRRVASDGKLYHGGAAPPAICGRSLGWDTKIPLAVWGTKSHIPQHWCLDCYNVANDELVKTALLPAMDIATKGLKPEGWVSAWNFKSLGSLDGKPRHKSKAAAAKAALKDLVGPGGEPSQDGDTFLVGRVRRSASFANGCFTEVAVMGDVVTYVMTKGAPRLKKP